MNPAIIVVFVSIVVSVAGIKDLYPSIGKDILLKGEAQAIIFSKKILAEDISRETVKAVIICGQTNLSLEGFVMGIYLLNCHKFTDVELVYTIPDERPGQTYAAELKTKCDILVKIGIELKMKIYSTKEVKLPTTEDMSASKKTVYVFDYIFGSNYRFEEDHYKNVLTNCQLLYDTYKAGFKIVVVDIYALQNKFDTAPFPNYNFQYDANVKLSPHAYISIEKLTDQTIAARGKFPNALYYMIEWNGSLKTAMENCAGNSLKSEFSAEIEDYRIVSFAAATNLLAVSKWINDNTSEDVKITELAKQYATELAASPV